MKILHISTGFPISFQGGITNYVRELANSQIAQGNEVWVMGGIDDKSHRFKYYTYSSNKIRPFTLGKLQDKEKLNEVSRFLKKENFDVIHIHMILDLDWDLYSIVKNYNYIVSLHDYFYLCPRICMVDLDKNLCKKYDENRCAHCIDLLEKYRYIAAIKHRLKWYLNLNINITSRNPITAIRFLKMKRLLEHAQLLLPVSERVKEIYIDSGIDGNYKVLHIGNISADEYEYIDIFPSVTDNRKINIAMLGSLSYLKGADIFLKIAQNIDREKFELHFYGRSATYKDRLKKYNIIDHGAYNQSELKNILKNIDIGLVLSVWEDNAPQVVMEFINNHIPVVGTQMGGIPDFVNTKNGYLFDPYDKNSFLSLIKFFELLTWDKLIKLKKNIKPTTTTKEHYKVLMKIYNDVLIGENKSGKI